MQPQSTEEAADALTHRSATSPFTSVALLGVFTIGAFLISLVGPAAASAQSAPAADGTGDTTTSTTAAPASTPPAEPAAPPATTIPASTFQAVPAPTPMPEPTRPEAARTRGPRNLAEANYVYQPREVWQAWNNSHSKKITLAEAKTLARYLNAVVAHQLRQYLLAVYLNAVAKAQVPGQAGWERVARCESGGRWNLSTGNGYYGGLQFSLSTWRSVGGTGYPHQNSKAEQMRRANILKARAGLGQWPHCGRHFHG